MFQQKNQTNLGCTLTELQKFNRASTLLKTLSPTVTATVSGTSYSKKEKYHFEMKGAKMVVATPGRLRQHLEDGDISINRFQLLVIDEADRILEEGFDDYL
jgi:superfamily II DNA/RNA helicase